MFDPGDRVYIFSTTGIVSKVDGQIVSVVFNDRFGQTSGNSPENVRLDSLQLIEDEKSCIKCHWVQGKNNGINWCKCENQKLFSKF